MDRSSNMKNIFADKATLILRKMLFNPNKRWVTRDFTGTDGISIGMAHATLETMAAKGYIERIKRGALSYTLLTNAKELLNDWARAYSFEMNEFETYYSPNKDILPKIKNHLQDKPYALTLHSGANLETSFVVTEDIYFYFKPDDWEKEVLKLRQALDLKELVSGGNIHIIKPYYRNSAFYGSRSIKGYNVASYLQLYLDLYNFTPRGREHAEYMRKVLEEKGKNLYGP